MCSTPQSRGILVYPPQVPFLLPRKYNLLFQLHPGGNYSLSLSRCYSITSRDTNKISCVCYFYVAFHCSFSSIGCLWSVATDFFLVRNAFLFFKKMALLIHISCWLYDAGNIEMPSPSIRKEKMMLREFFIEICIITTIIPLNLSNTDEAAWTNVNQIEDTTNV